jgi:DNA polymerase-3 subunit alpha
MCNFDPIKQDVLRKATAKKDESLLNSLKEDFINGAILNGENKQKLEEFWEKMLGFSRYSFNKSHSVAYAYLSYYSAYFKANYPTEFCCACISCETDPEAQSVYVNDAKRRGIEIIPPDINFSEMDFSIFNGKIVYGFKGLKGIGEKAIVQIIENKPYTDATHFLRVVAEKKLKIPKQVLEALIRIGAFDSFGVNRRLMLDSYDKFLVDYKGYLKKPLIDLPMKYNDDTCTFKGDVDGLTLFDILTYEKRYMGVYISGNPFDFAKNVIGSSTFTFEEAKRQSTASVFCEIMSVKITKTKSKGEKMGIYKCIDSSNNIFEFPLFPDSYAKYGESIEEGYFIVVNFKNNGSRGLVCLSVKNVNSLIDEYTKTLKSENAINSIAIKVDSLAGLRKFFTRKGKETVTDLEFLRPCHVFFTAGSYTFGIGTIPYSSSNDSIRLLNQIEEIEIKINR